MPASVTSLIDWYCKEKIDQKSTTVITRGIFSCSGRLGPVFRLTVNMALPPTPFLPYLLLLDTLLSVHVSTYT